MHGAFFPQFDAEVPEEEVTQHASEHVMIPSRIFPDLIVIHAQFGFCLLEALLDSPAHAAEPYEELQSCAHRCVADIVGILPVGAESSFDNEPNRLVGEPSFAEGDASLGKFRHDNGILTA